MTESRSPMEEPEGSSGIGGLRVLILAWPIEGGALGKVGGLKGTGSYQEMSSTFWGFAYVGGLGAKFPSKNVGVFLRAILSLCQCEYQEKQI